MENVRTRRAGSWMDANLSVQGYCLTAEEKRSLRWGLRFPTALCLALVITGLVLQSSAIVLALVPIGAVAGWTARHPFDLLWNHGLRHRTGAPEVPPNPTPRRHAFKLATVWLLAVGLLFAFGLETAALILGSILVGVCGLVTATNFCVPSTLLGLWWRRRGVDPATA
jgi:cation transporter-like permease